MSPEQRPVDHGGVTQLTAAEDTAAARCRRVVVKLFCRDTEMIEKVARHTYCLLNKPPQNTYI